MQLEGKLFEGEELERLKRFLEHMGLKYDEEIEYSVCLTDENRKIIGCGSVERNVIKCVAIDEAYQGQGLLSTIMSELIQYLFERGKSHIFIYTKPENLNIFMDMGFYVVHKTEEILLMENKMKGFSLFLKKLREETPAEALKDNLKVGAVVANCNPFTLGHKYLLEQATRECDYLHLFILSDSRGTFSAQERCEMAKKGMEGVKHIIFHQTSDYMISAATFPTYFFKDAWQGARANCRMDIEIFSSRIAPQLHITRRYVGTEPYCKITRAYNEEMRKLLPECGIEVIEKDRYSQNGIPVSASAVRKYILDGKWKKIRDIVPEEVFPYLCKMKQIV